MAELTEAFKAQYPKNGYGYGYRAEPDYTRCAKALGRYMRQCTNLNGYGPEGAWCRQHNPIAVEEKWKAKNAEWDAKFARERLLSNLKAERASIIEQIAAGHNDPR